MGLDRLWAHSLTTRDAKPAHGEEIHHDQKSWWSRHHDKNNELSIDMETKDFVMAAKLYVLRL